MHVTEAARILEVGDAVVLDVRIRWEYERGRIPGSIHMPIQEVPKRLAELEHYRDRTILVLCHSGQRSYIIARWLKKKGFQTENITGGIFFWRWNKLPIDKDAP